MTRRNEVIDTLKVDLEDGNFTPDYLYGLVYELGRSDTAKDVLDAVNVDEALAKILEASIDYMFESDEHRVSEGADA